MRLWWLPLIVACNGRCRPDPEDCDAADLRTFYADNDGDGHGDPLDPIEKCQIPGGAATVGDDCDDEDGTVWATASLWVDDDGDGHGAGAAVEVCLGASGYADVSGDCDDADATRYPDAPRECGDGTDQDCDGLSDCDPLTGSADVADAAATRFYGDAGSGLGGAVAGLGDLNGDGLSDLGLGATDTSWGQALLYMGPLQSIEDADSADTTLVAVVTDESATAIHLGASLAAADITGDGVRDVLVGAGDGVRVSMGSSIFIVPGPVADGEITVNDGASALVLVATGGRSMVTDKDYTGSETVDLIAAGYGLSLFEGPVSSSGEVEDLRSGEIASGTEGFGEALALGDLDGDGVLDLLVGASRLSEDLPDSEDAGEVGGAFIFASPADFRDTSMGYYNYDDLAIFGLTDGAQLGAALTFAGDPNGDGYDDLYVGAPGAEDESGETTGAVYYFDGATLAGLAQESEIYADAATSTFFGGEAGDEFGASVLAGLTIDGQATLVIGATGHDDETGAVALWYEQPSATDTLYEADYRLSGTAAGDRFGAALANAGDTNGLGWDDLLIGAPGTSGGDGAGWLLVFDQL